MHLVRILRVAIGLLVALAGVGLTSPVAVTRESVENEYAHGADDYGDVPPDIGVLDEPAAPVSGPQEGPSAQGVLTPQVVQSGNVYTWKFEDMSAKSLGPFNVISDTWGGGPPNLNREFAKDPTNSKNFALKVKYPKGTTTPTSKFNPPGVRGGVGFYATPIDPAILQKAKQVSLEYSVYFPPDFNFVRGGKLPGLYGGAGNARGCSGGSAAADCYSARFMWRKAGDGELYLYTPISAVQDPGYCKVPPLSYCDPGYGDSIGRGAVKFKVGTWNRIKITVALNTVGKRDGLVKMSANGKDVVVFNKVVWRVLPTVFTKGIMFQTFFGGSTADWATPTETYTMYKDFVMTAVL